MLATLRRKLKWGSNTPSSDNDNTKSYLVLLFAGLLEKALFWRSTWFSITFIGVVQVIFLICTLREVSLFQFIIYFSLTMIIMDAIESWLKHRHRTTFLKRISNIESTKLNLIMLKLKQWLISRWEDFISMRQTDPSKAFMLVNLILGILFLLGRYINGYLFTYMISMAACILYKVAPPLIQMYKTIMQDTESDSELEGLIPVASEVDIMNLLSIEPEINQVVDEKQSLDYWKPDDVPIEEASDSSENSSSLVTNFSMEKVDTLQNDVETSDSSEDEYIPLEQHKEQLQSTLEIIEPSSSWGSSAYNAFWNITGAVANMVQSDKDGLRKRISSADSSDGFEMIDKNELN